MTRLMAVVGMALLVAAGAAGTEAGEPRPLRAEQRLEPEEVRAAVLRHLERDLRAGGEVDVRLLEPTAPVPLPAGAVTIRVSGPGGEAGSGRRQMLVALAVDGKPVRSLTVTVEVEVQVEAVAPVRPIATDEVLAAEDLAVVMVRLPEGRRADFVRRVEDAAGRRAVRPLPPHRPIGTAGLALPYAVRKGERVVIEARRGGLTIRAAGLTKAAGVVGQTVAVTNLDSGKPLQATVRGPGLVEVGF
jgi:flagella basal body P-ring formation protein FlgA